MHFFTAAKRPEHVGCCPRDNENSDIRRSVV